MDQVAEGDELDIPLHMGADLDGEQLGYIPTFIEQADRLNEANAADSSDSEDELRAEVDSHMLASGKAHYLDKCVELGLTPVSQVVRYLGTGNELPLGHYGLGVRGATALAAALKVNKSLSVLRLADNHLGGVGCKLILEALRTNPGATELDVSENHIGGTEGSLCRLSLASYIMEKHNRLTLLNLQANRLTDQDAAVLCDALSQNMKMTSLDVSHNTFGDKAGVALGLLFQSPSTLKELHVGWNRIRSKGAVAMAEGLRSNGTVEVLDLGWNGVSDDGFVAFGELLASDSTHLVELVLSCNGAGTRGALGLAEGLKTNDSLALIDVDHNTVHEEGGEAILAALEANAGILACNMTSTDTSAALLEVVAALLKGRNAVVGGMEADHLPVG